MGLEGSRGGRDLVIAALIAFGVVAALLVDTRLESRADEPTLAVHTVRWTGDAAGGPARVAPTPALPGAARQR